TNVKKGFYKGIDNIFSETTSRSEDFDSLANNTALNSETVELLLKISARRTGKILGTPTIIPADVKLSEIRAACRWVVYKKVQDNLKVLPDDQIIIQAKLAEVVAKTLVKEGYEQKNGQSSEQVMNNQQEVSKSNSSMSDEEEVVDTSVSAEIVLKEKYKEKFERGGFGIRLAGVNREVRKKVANKRKIGREYESEITREDVELNIEIDEEFRNEERDNESWVNNYSKLGDFGRKIT
ncbi:17493_t:CDS:2, partial [Rhizophagus irregularis]